MGVDYYAGGTRVAMSDNGTIRYFVTDHLGSTTKLININGSEFSDVDYLSWGSDSPIPTNIGTSFKYTGQRHAAGAQSGAEAGLYFYNARWYDPEVGRFIQADSIIPEPGNPLAWDRYAYVNNNPVNSIDPSGHIRITDGTDNKYGQVPTIIDTSQLTDDDDPTGSIGGYQAYQTYIRAYIAKNGFWWDIFGKDGNFTLDEFLALIWYWEAQGFWDDPSIPESALRKASTFCAGQCSNEGYLNWIGGWSNSIQGRYRGGGTAGFNTIENYKNDSDLIYLANSFMNPDDSWLSGCRSSEGMSRPCGSANLSYYYSLSADISNKMRNNPNRMFTYTGGNNPWIIPSGCVDAYWNDLSILDLTVDCPIVR
jgi:RHS repeat-associated protein